MDRILVRRAIIRMMALVFLASPWACKAEPRTPDMAPGEGWVTLPSGAKLYYRAMGSGADTIVVPGAAFWAAPLEPLTQEHTVIFYDLLGRGRSDPADTTRIAMDSIVADLEALRQHFGLERMGLVGASVTGVAAAAYAVRYPARVTRLALVNPMAPSMQMQAAYDPPERAARIDTAAQSEVLRLRRSGGDAAAICRQFWKANMGWFVGDPAAAARIDPSWCAVPNETTDAALLWIGYLIRAAGAWDVTSAARGIAAPTLIVRGERDYWVPPAGAEAWAAAIPGARLMTLPGAGHLALLEAPQPVTTALTEFFAGRWPAGAEPVRR